MAEYCIETYVSTDDEDKVEMVVDLFASWLNCPSEATGFLERGLQGVDFEGIVVNMMDHWGEKAEQIVNYNALHKFFVMAKDDFGKYTLATSRSFDSFGHALKYADGIASSRKAVVLAAVGSWHEYPDIEPYPDFTKSGEIAEALADE